MIIDLPQPFAVVAHDAGAANHIIEWLAIEAPQCRPFLRGPAEDIWRRRFPGRPCHASLDEALDKACAVLSGTGWGSDLEHNARVLGHRAGLRTVAVLDHWVNYPMRFERQGIRRLPDEAWVTDTWAEGVAQRSFPGLAVCRKPNSYLAASVEQVNALGAGESGTLFVLEPVRDNWGRGELGEFQALDYFLHRRAALSKSTGDPIRLRPHPSDPPGKYDAWLARNAGEGVVMDDSTSLPTAIARSRMIVGIQSFALVIADAAGRPAVSTLPPWAPALNLPQPGILELRRLCGDTL